MFCEKCGAKLNENDLFCGSCGEKIATPQLKTGERQISGSPSSDFTTEEWQKVDEANTNVEEPVSLNTQVEDRKESRTKAITIASLIIALILVSIVSGFFLFNYRGRNNKMLTSIPNETNWTTNDYQDRLQESNEEHFSDVIEDFNNTESSNISNDNEDNSEALHILKGRKFSDGKAWVLIAKKDDTVAMAAIDKNGKILFEFDDLNPDSFSYNFEYCTSDFENGVAYTELRNDTDVIFNSDGDIIAQSGEKFDSILSANGGFFLAYKEPEGYEEKNRKYLIIDNTGEISYVFPDDIDLAGIGSDFTALDDAKLLKNGIIINLADGSILDFYGGYVGQIQDIFIFSSRGDYYYKNNGEEINIISHLDINPDFDSGKDIKTVTTDSRLKKFYSREILSYDINGIEIDREKLSFLIYRVSDFSESVIGVYIDGSDGYYFTLIDENNNLLFEPVQFEADIHLGIYDSKMSCGLFRCEGVEADTTMFLDKKGNIIFTIDEPYSYVSDFNEDISCVNSGSYCYYFNKNGDILF